MSYPISKTVLAAQKSLIRSCVELGVGIEFLDDSAPAFRFIPAPDFAVALPDYAKPSKRKGHSIKCRNRRNCQCHKSKWFKHSPLVALADYFIPMRGDSDDLTEARKAYHDGHPQALRDWLGATAPERLAAWAEIDAALPIELGDTMSRDPMTAAEFRDARLRLDWTQEELAAWGGVTRKTIQRFETAAQPVPEIWRKALEGLAIARGVE